MSKIQEIIADAVETKTKIIEMLTPPCPDDYARPKRYAEAKAKHKEKAQRLIRVLLLVFNRFKYATVFNNDQVRISLSKLNSIMAGGYRVRERNTRVLHYNEIHHSDGTITKAFTGGYSMQLKLVRDSKSWYYRDMVKMIVEMFFDIVEEGTMFTGSSIYSPKKEIVITEAQLAMLLSFLEINRDQLRQFYELFNTVLEPGKFKIGDVVDVKFSELVFDTYDPDEVTMTLCEMFRYRPTEHERRIAATQIKLEFKNGSTTI